MWFTGEEVRAGDTEEDAVPSPNVQHDTALVVQPERTQTQGDVGRHPPSQRPTRTLSGTEAQVAIKPGGLCQLLEQKVQICGYWL